MKESPRTLAQAGPLRVRGPWAVLFFWGVFVFCRLGKQEQALRVSSVSQKATNRTSPWGYRGVFLIKQCPHLLDIWCRKCPLFLLLSSIFSFHKNSLYLSWVLGAIDNGAFLRSHVIQGLGRVSCPLAIFCNIYTYYVTGFVWFLLMFVLVFR